MTRASTIDFGRKKQGELLGSGPLRPANIIRNKFHTYKNGSNGIVIKLADGPEMPSLKEAVAKETTDLLDRHQRLSVRELTMKFEKGFNTATLLSNEMDILAVQLSKREDELLQQKAEVTKIAATLKLASEDAKRIIDEERANARLEIESAKAVVQKIELEVKKQESISQRNGKQDVDELNEEVQEARRVKMLHCPSKAMDIENEIQVLRDQLTEKSSDSLRLLKELELHRRYEENDMPFYELKGLETLGSMLRIVVRDYAHADFSNSSIQWFRMQPEGSKQEIISGATKPVYAPEPHDVGRYLQAEIQFGGQISIAKTAGPVDPAAGLVDYVEALVRNPETEYNVVILQVNGIDQAADCLHVLCIGRLRMRLAKEKAVVAKEFYSSSMQVSSSNMSNTLCGVRGGGDAAPQAVFWQPRKDLSFVLAFETTRERNSALMLARRFAIDCNIILAGPGDKTPC
ncbi:hypothetical protein BS78_02G369200 [Paspalum vaginatum]|nr:hypothetical protein BS78_02G369200 [Paspalum vaginatum]